MNYFNSCFEAILDCSGFSQLNVFGIFFKLYVEVLLDQFLWSLEDMLNSYLKSSEVS